jgi:asparagine N-glycosylation enzyme membrane subunit Stt3
MPDAESLWTLWTNDYFYPVLVTVCGLIPALFGTRWSRFSWLFLSCGFSMWSFMWVTQKSPTDTYINPDRVEWFLVAIVAGIAIGTCAFFLRKLTKALLALGFGLCAFGAVLGGTGLNLVLAVIAGVAAAVAVGWLHEKLEGMALAGCGAFLIALAWGLAEDPVWLGVFFASALFVQILWSRRGTDEKNS